MAHTLILALGDPEQRAQLSHARLLTYKTVSYKISVALSHYICGNLLMAARERKPMHREGQCVGRGWGPLTAGASAQPQFIPSFAFCTWFMSPESISQ